jgi:hypothetical protein
MTTIPHDLLNEILPFMSTYQYHMLTLMNKKLKLELINSVVKQCESTLLYNLIKVYRNELYLYYIGHGGYEADSLRGQLYIGTKKEVNDILRNNINDFLIVHDYVKNNTLVMNKYFKTGKVSWYNLEYEDVDKIRSEAIEYYKSRDVINVMQGLVNVEDYENSHVFAHKIKNESIKNLFGKTDKQILADFFDGKAQLYIFGICDGPYVSDPYLTIEYKKQNIRKEIYDNFDTYKPLFKWILNSGGANPCGNLDLINKLLGKTVKSRDPEFGSYDVEKNEDSHKYKKICSSTFIDTVYRFYLKDINGLKLFINKIESSNIIKKN